MNHSGDANKMVSDTPRTDAAYFKPGATMYDLAGEMKRVERELNAANERIKRLEEESESDWHLAQSAIGSCAEMSSRIKRLEEFARTIENDFDHDEDAHRYGTMCRVCDAAELLRETKTKEAKP